MSERPRDDTGSTLPLIIGFALVALLLVAVVTDVSAAYLRRQNLDSLAEGAALHGADLGAQGGEVYAGGLAEERLGLSTAAVRASVHDYLSRAGAFGRYPGLGFTVRIDESTHRVEVSVASRFELPLSVPGVATATTVRATGSASVLVER